MSKTNKTDRSKPRTADVVRKEAQDNLDKALDCFKAACEALSELLAIYAAQAGAGMQQAPQPQKPDGKQATKQEKKQAKKQAKPPKPAKAAKPAKPAKPVKPAAATTDMQTGKGKEPEKKGDDVVRGSSVRMAPHELTLNVGSQPVKELAEADAKDLLNNPKVFWYRPIQFPDPKRYQVQPRIISARPVERKGPKFTRAPWSVSVTVEARGDDKRCASWLTGVLNKNKADQE